jgi:hypothetical protein
VILPFFAVHNYPGSYKVHGAMCQCLAFQVNLRLEATLIQVHEERERTKQTKNTYQQNSGSGCREGWSRFLVVLLHLR